MENKITLYIYGAIIIFGGLFLLIYQNSDYNTIRITLGSTLIIGAVFSFLTALSSKKKQVQFDYHEMHALAMLVYGVSVLVFCNKLETLINFTSFLFFFYAFSEIIFCLRIFDLGRKVIYKIVFTRLLLGLIVGIGTVMIMNYYDTSNTLVLRAYGTLFIIIGVNILLYVPIMKKIN